MAFHTVKCNVLSVTPKGYNMGVVNYDHAGSNFPEMPDMIIAGPDELKPGFTTTCTISAYHK